eukprot:CAMPEP_0203759662 /NCGR_PEP_ID=MMETSP0098-20131031/12767_1 /ASSEMBLY_ACC=CAM_ASM_000208 /TAXON_ID=96639 /ORGANISM=" , Strain NY0313808BC1" /LENGTH=615 /DNA_ID=CAMNT_0050652769 /DNA_START=1063 /DNA_END=2906 /DNA_ORIENTATION=-
MKYQVLTFTVAIAASTGLSTNDRRILAVKNSFDFADCIEDGMIKTEKLVEGAQAIIRKLEHFKVIEEESETPGENVTYDKFLQADAYKIAKSSSKFPDQDLQGEVAFAFSGGGNRALTVATGQLRALESKNFLDKVDIMSGVSGGAWATGLYQYAPGADLGTHVNLSELTLEKLKSDKVPGMAKPATTNWLTTFFGILVDLFARGKKIKLSAFWDELIGRIYLKPFGLDSNTKFFTLNSTTRKTIVEKNAQAGLTNDDFILPVTVKRPYWIASASMMSPIADRRDDEILSLQFTSLFAGIPCGINEGKMNYTNRFVEFIKDQKYTGGGYVENFALGAHNPLEVSTQISGGKLSLGFDPNAPRLTLKRVLSMSSMAFGYTLASSIVSALVPRQNYWPLLPKGAKKTQTVDPYHVADGGAIEFLGLLPMLQRGMTKVAVFVQENVPLPSRKVFDACNATDFSPAWNSTTLNPLFGQKITSAVGSWVHNRVFKTSEYFDLVCEFQKKHESGKAAIVTSTHQLLANDWWGIEGGKNVTIVWFYLNRAEDFIKELPKETQDELRRTDSKAAFANFPHFKTELQNGLTKPVSFTQAQVNLLQHYGSWQIHQGADQLTKLLG